MEWLMVMEWFLTWFILLGMLLAGFLSDKSKLNHILYSKVDDPCGANQLWLRYRYYTGVPLLSIVRSITYMSHAMPSRNSRELHQYVLIRPRGLNLQLS
jgi:hypothetical protein